MNLQALIENESLNAECDGEVGQEFAVIIKVARDTRSWERITSWLDLREAVGDLAWESDRPDMESLKNRVPRWLDEHAEEYGDRHELIEALCDAFDVHEHERYGIMTTEAMSNLVDDWPA